MKKIVGLSGIMITLSILIIGGILFYQFIDDQIGGFVIIFSFLGLLMLLFLTLVEMNAKS